MNVTQRELRLELGSRSVSFNGLRLVCESIKLPLKPLEALVRQKVTEIHVLRLHRDNRI